MLNLGVNRDQEDKALRILLSNGLAIFPMTIMIKDHKSLSLDSEEPPPSRSIMNGKLGMNMNMSEFISLVMEPIANEDKDNLETNFTDGLIADIKGINRLWRANKEKNHEEVPDGGKSSHEKDLEEG